MIEKANLPMKDFVNNQPPGQGSFEGQEMVKQPNIF